MLLVMSAVSLFFAPKVNSQQFTTISSRITSTLTRTSSWISNVTITQTTLVTTATLTTLRLFIGGMGGACVTEAIDLNPPPPGAGAFWVGSVQKVHLDYTSNAQIDIWVLSNLMWSQLWYDTTFHRGGADPCDPGLGPTYGYASYRLAVMERSGSADFVMGPNMLYIVHRRDMDPGVTPVVKLSVNGVSRVITLASTSIFLVTDTQTTTTFLTKEVPFLEANATWLLPVVLVVIVLVLFLVIRMRSHRRTVQEESR
jgi:hypothetical protein